MTDLKIEIAYPKLWLKKSLANLRFNMFKDDRLHSLAYVLETYEGNGRCLLEKDEKKLPFSESEILWIEQYRLVLMKSVYQKLINKRLDEKTPEKEKTGFFNEHINHWLKTSLFLFAGVVGAIETGIWTYYGSVAAVTALLPAIISMTVIPLCVVFTVVSVLQFISFEVGQVKQLLGISPLTNSQEILAVVKEQIKYAKKMNQALDNRFTYARLMREKTYEDFHAAASVFNMDIENRRKNFEEYKESQGKKAFRYSVTAFGFLLALIETYFGTSMLLAMISAGLVGTPIATVITGFIMASTVILYFSVRGSGLGSQLNRELEESKKVKEALFKFEQPLEIKKQNIAEPKIEKKLPQKVENKISEKNFSLLQQSIFCDAKARVTKVQEAMQSLRPVF